MFEALYKRFNARDIDALLARLSSGGQRSTEPSHHNGSRPGPTAGST
jgi:hypothetical protein